MLHICGECCHQFDFPKIVHEYMGDYWGSPAIETTERCPYCGSYDIIETDLCTEENCKTCDLLDECDEAKYGDEDIE